MPRKPERPLQSLELTNRGKVLVGLLALAVTATWLTGDPHSRLAASLLLAPLAIDLLGKGQKLSLLEIVVAPRRTVAGMPFADEIWITNSHPRRTFRDVVLSEPRTVTIQGGTVLESIRPGHAQRADLACRSRQRSHLLERVFELQTTWPLGLLRSRAVVKAEAELITEPGRLELPQRMLRAAADGHPSWHANDRMAGHEFHSLREYLPDEDARRVHAFRSAATGTLVRRVLRGHEPREVAVVLDLRRPPGRNLNLGQQRLEWSLSACATILDHTRAENMTAHCLVIGNEEHLFQRVADGRDALEVLTWLSEAAAVPFTTIDSELLGPLTECASCYWIPAGGYMAHGDMAELRHAVTVVGMEDL